MFSTQAPTASAAGNTQQPAGVAQPSLFSGFGQQQQQQNQPTQSLFGNLGQTQQQQPGASLIGQSNPSGGAPGLFGSSTATAGQPPATGAPAFGGGSWNSGNPLLPKSAFGAGTSMGPNQPQQQGAGLGTGLFGQQPQQQQQQSTGFGGSLFGSAQNPPQQPSVFSSSTNQAKPSMGFGLSTAPTQQPTAQTGQPLFTKSTKFNDLPENVKKTFEDIEAHIQGRLQISKDLKQRQVGDEATKGQDLIRGMHKDLINSITVLQNDILSTRDLKAKVDQSVQDTIVAVHIIDGFRNPQQHGAHLRNHANFPLEFFTRITDQMRKRLQSYKETIEQIERKLTSAAQQVQYTPQVITATLEAQNTSFVALANKIAALDTDLQRLKALYTQLWRAKTGSMRDPFSQLDRGSGGEFGVESLYGK
ncbi:hypothetical protein EDB92DRAFT_1866013 [Lactarius akahatsu]|uniref:Nucleoporin p58/p45 n=1 Tax=Lactarius akahatsu TaxID=416441 RepID=A0AAD4LFD6_9AGAM|nr:hypothetical protein EDB92DRAFT_1866013 [Lactarius akahatsu]